MSKVIDLEDRLKLEQRKKAKVDKAKKLDIVRKTVQCTRCLARCAKCNVQFDTQEMYQRFKGPYRFCPICQEEYEEFVRLRGTGEKSPHYWHNNEWFQVWQTWLDYQQAMKNYGESKEFLELVQEVEWER